MPRIQLTTLIHARVERVFDLARDITLHERSQARHSERAIAGRTSGLIETGEEVTWEARHFGIRQRLTSRLITMESPRHFRDAMIHGVFRRMVHDHFFSEPSPNVTVMTDIFDYTGPLGLLGRIADGLFLKRYLRRLLSERSRAIRECAEDDAPSELGEKCYRAWGQAAVAKLP